MAIWQMLCRILIAIERNPSDYLTFIIAQDEYERDFMTGILTFPLLEGLCYNTLTGAMIAQTEVFYAED
jgi:hypothetical protein